jgi:pyridoxal phosphate enzyme (YggS family)
LTRAEEITRNLAAVRARIAAATREAGRVPGFGENYAQELRDKYPAVLAVASPAGAPPGAELRWHFIGPLQSNKVKYLAGRVALLHTVDTPALLEEISRRLPPHQGVQDCLVQVNVAREPQKRGVAPEDLPGLLERFAEFPRLRCEGLMLIPPFDDNPEASRPHFRALRELRDEAARVNHGNVELHELSMGMSHDLQVAIAEGATMVRVGTAIFGARGSRR